MRYEGIEEDLREAGLEEEDLNWENVDDLKWLRAVKPPSWSVLEDSERIGRVEVEDPERAQAEWRMRGFRVRNFK